MEVISSAQNKSIKLLESLRQRKYREKHNAFLVEGLRSVRDALEAKQLKSIFISKNISEELEIQRILDLAMKQGLFLYEVEEKIFSRLSQTEHTQGIVAVGEKQAFNYDDFSPKAEEIYLLLEEVQDPGNLGTIIRTALAAGVSAIFTTKGSVDAYNDKVVRSAMSALGKIPIYEGLDKEAINALVTQKGLHTYAATLEDAQDYHRISYHYPLLLVFGNEGRGLSRELTAQCEGRIKIPLYGDMESLNLSIAVGICVYKVREMRE